MKLFQPKKKRGATLTSTQVSELIYSLVCDAATEAAKYISEHILKVENEDAEKRKLEFDLIIAFIVVALDSIPSMTKQEKRLRTIIMDGVCDLYFRELEKLPHVVDAGFFIRDKDERELFCAQLPPTAKVNADNLHCQTTPFALALILFNKRFLEYQELWQLDMKKALTKQPGFIPDMPHKVYEHWSGKSGEELRTFEFLMFATIELFTRFSSLSLALAKQLSEITIKKN